MPMQGASESAQGIGVPVEGPFKKRNQCVGAYCTFIDNNKIRHRKDWLILEAFLKKNVKLRECWFCLKVDIVSILFQAAPLQKMHCPYKQYVTTGHIKNQ